MQLRCTITELLDGSQFCDHQRRVTVKVEDADSLFRTFRLKDAAERFSLGEEFVLALESCPAELAPF